MTFPRFLPMAETIGQLVDRLAQLELHRWHVERLLRDPECGPSQIETCQEHLRELDRQRARLQQQISRLWATRHIAADPSMVLSPRDRVPGPCRVCPIDDDETS